MVGAGRASMGGRHWAGRTRRFPMAARKKAAPKAKPAKPAASPKTKETKQQRLIAMLKRPDGATITQMMKALGCEPYTQPFSMQSSPNEGFPYNFTSGLGSFRRK